MTDTKLNLQLFAEGGDAGDAAEAAPETAEAEAEQSIDRATKWKEMINGEYRDEYKKSIESQLDRRFKEQESMRAKLDSQGKLSSFLAQRYGVDENDTDGLLSALQNDDALFESAAAERGLTTDQYKEVRRLEFENAQLQKERERAEADAAAQEIYADWVRQSDNLKAQFPNFELREELENPDFLSMLQSGVSVEHAFKVLHMEDIMGGLAQYTAQNVASKVTEGIMAKGMRPTENGIGRSSQPVKEQIDVSNLTLDDINKLADRVRHGERIVL